MNYCKNIYCFIGICFIIHHAAAQDVPKLRIDPSTAYGGYVSEYFSNIEYIPLETTKESLFGDVGELFITDSSIIVYDYYDTRTILFFSPTGKFIRKIKCSSQLSYRLHFNSQKDILTVLVVNIFKQQLEELQYYDKFGNKLETQPRGLYFINPDLVIPLADEYFIQFSPCTPRYNGPAKDSTCFLISLYKGDSLCKSFIPYNQFQDMGFCSLASSVVMIKDFDNPDSLYYSTPLNYYVYKIKKDTCILQFQFVFPKERVLSADILHSHDKSYINDIQQSLFYNPKMISNVSNIFFNKNLLFFKLDSWSYPRLRNASESEYQYNFIYDTVSHKLVSLEHMTSDEMSYFLPIIGIYTLEHGVYYGGKAQALYSVVSSLSMFEAKEKTKIKNPQYPPVLEKYFNTQNRKSNPVIVKMKLKG